MSDKLEACPFCGGEATVSSEACGWRVDCIERNCYTRGPWPDDCTEADTVAAWNTRTPTPEQAGEVEPVAWLYEKNGKQSIQMKRQPWNTEPDRGWTETALFASTPPAPELNKSATDPANSTQGLATPTADAVDAKAIAAEVVQSVCETDPADPEHPDTVSIEVSDLGAIVRQAVENATEATMAGDYVMVPRDFVEFLCGSQPWENVWFGDQNPVGRGNFWWRKALRGFAATSPTGGE